MLIFLFGHPVWHFFISPSPPHKAPYKSIASFMKIFKRFILKPKPVQVKSNKSFLSYYESNSCKALIFFAE